MSVRIEVDVLNHILWSDQVSKSRVFLEVFSKRQELVQDIALNDSRSTNELVKKIVIGVPGHNFLKLCLQLFLAFIRIEMPPFASSTVIFDHSISLPQNVVTVLVDAGSVPASFTV